MKIAFAPLRYHNKLGKPKMFSPWTAQRSADKANVAILCITNKSYSSLISSNFSSTFRYHDVIG